MVCDGDDDQVLVSHPIDHAEWKPLESQLTQPVTGLRTDFRVLGYQVECGINLCQKPRTERLPALLQVITQGLFCFTGRFNKKANGAFNHGSVAASIG